MIGKCNTWSAPTTRKSGLPADDLGKERTLDPSYKFAQLAQPVQVCVCGVWIATMSGPASASKASTASPEKPSAAEIHWACAVACGRRSARKAAAFPTPRHHDGRPRTGARLLYTAYTASAEQQCVPAVVRLCVSVGLAKKSAQFSVMAISNQLD